MNNAVLTESVPSQGIWRAATRWAARYQIVLIGVVLAVAVWIRVADLDSVPFWVDEAESSINGLTILQHGYPTDTYLGLPIFENILFERWPESSEYEFRDLSYSKKHVAIYHGWLPLYAIAASFAVQNIRPDHVGTNETWTSKHDLAEQKRRTRAARLPGAAFGALFLAIAFVGGKLLYGTEAGWIGLIVGAVNPWHIAISRQARYYSAEVTFTAACCVAVWLLIQRCTWKRVVFAAACFILLFYSHLLSFAAATMVFVLVCPWIFYRNGRGALPKLAVFGAVVTAATLPWVFLTGFLQSQHDIPGPWSLLEFPADLLRYPPLSWLNVFLGLTVTLSVLFVLAYRDRIPRRLSAPLLRLSPVLVFLAIWAACGYLCFLRFMPAASFARERLNLSYWGPLFLLESAIWVAIARIIKPRTAGVVGLCLMLLMLYIKTDRWRVIGTNSVGRWENVEIVLQHLDQMHLASDTKVFSVPNDQLIFTFYSGSPVQDITPVRRSYLDSYRGDIVYIEPSIPVYAGVLTPESVREAALRNGIRLTHGEAQHWSTLLQTRDVRETVLNTAGPDTATTLEQLPTFARQLMKLQRCYSMSLFSSYDYEFMVRDFALKTWSDWRTVIKYRFVNPVAHWGTQANYAERLRDAEAVILPGVDTVIYRSHAYATGPTADRGMQSYAPLARPSAMSFVR